MNTHLCPSCGFEHATSDPLAEQVLLDRRLLALELGRSGIESRLLTLEEKVFPGVSAVVGKSVEDRIKDLEAAL